MIKRITELPIAHAELAESHWLGSTPAWALSLQELRDQLLSGVAYEFSDARTWSGISLIPMARESSGVWMLESLVDVAADEAHWQDILRDVVRVHVKSHFTSRIVQRYSVGQKARSAATRKLGWTREGELPQYFRVGSQPAAAEQWSLMAEAVA